jgi:Putative phage tail protein
MPQAFVAVGAFFAQIAIGAGATFTAATVIGTVGAAVVFGAGAFAIGTLLTPKPQNPNRPADAQAVINQATSPRVRVYGYAKVGGTRAFFDSKNAQLHQIIMVASHRVDEFVDIYLGDKKVTLESDGDVSTSPWGLGGTNSYATILTRPGSTTQTLPAMITDAFSQLTSSHQLKGIAIIVSRFKSPEAEEVSRIFPQGHNTPVRCVLKGARVYDPRDNDQDADDEDTWEWSENSGLCILDYIRHPDGMNKPDIRIDFDSFSAFANLCDQNVPLASGGTEKRYRLGGTVLFTEDPADVLARMLATCDGELYQTSEGKIAIRGGKWEAPTVSISADQILSIGELSEGNDALSAFNELKVVYTSRSHDYQPTETLPWIDTTAQNEHGPLVEDLVLDMVPSPSQARRLAKIHMHKMNPEIRGSIVTNLAGLNALGERVIDLSIPEFSVSHSCLVTGFSLRTDLSGCEINISSITAAAYEWDEDTEEGENPPDPQDTAPDLTLPTPQNVTLSIVTSKVKAVVDDPDRFDLNLEAQVKDGAGGTYADMNVSDYEALSVSNVSSGITYYVRTRWERDGLVGPYSAEVTITAP